LTCGQITSLRIAAPLIRGAAIRDHWLWSTTDVNAFLTGLIGVAATAFIHAASRRLRRSGDTDQVALRVGEVPDH
jgi:hypothetical protein